ncbi:MAG: ABC transporter ATP-binding protein [Chryseolinea sp.]
MRDSSKYVIETEGLNFSFEKSRPIVQNLNLKVDEGSIFGFLGPNGAGKTTTIRLLLGLLTPSSGNVKLFETALLQHRLKLFSQIGALVETPSLYLHLSGFDNLNITRKIRGLNRNRIDEVLEMVELKGTAKILVKKYSLGMKQRLGLALALLSEPRLLILDEPVNGLDPNGIIDTRELLVRLNREYGITLFVSSHLLAEIERIATHVGIIKAGNMIFQGTIAELQNLQQHRSILQIDTNDNSRASQLIHDKYNTAFNNGIVEVSYQHKEQLALICQMLVGAGISIYKLQVQRGDLESIFLNMINN